MLRRRGIGRSGTLAFEHTKLVAISVLTVHTPAATQALATRHLDATYSKARVGRRVASQAVVIATGVRADGDREVLGFDVGDFEKGAFWTSFLWSLKAGGRTGVQLVISDAHEGLKTAIASVLLGSSWQMCRVHLTRNVLDAASKTNAEMVAAAIRTVFAQPDAAHVSDQSAVMLGLSHPKVAGMLTDTREDLLAFTAFPAGHRKKAGSTNPLERLNSTDGHRPPQPLRGLHGPAPRHDLTATQVDAPELLPA